MSPEIILVCPGWQLRHVRILLHLGLGRPPPDRLSSRRLGQSRSGGGANPQQVLGQVQSLLVLQFLSKHVQLSLQLIFIVVLNIALQIMFIIKHCPCRPVLILNANLSECCRAGNCFGDLICEFLLLTYIIHHVMNLKIYLRIIWKSAYITVSHVIDIKLMSLLHSFGSIPHGGEHCSVSTGTFQSFSLILDCVHGAINLPQLGIKPE